MKNKIITVIIVLVVIISCGSSPSSSVNKSNNTAKIDELDIAIRDTSDYLNKNIPKGSKVVILNIESSFHDLSNYIIDELIANAVNDRIFSVVDRQQLDAIRAEQNFQLSGEVDDKDALAIGKIFGAKTIVSGAVNRLGTGFRIRIRALEVQTAQVQGQFNRNIASSPIMTSLIASGGSPYGTATTTGSRQAQTALSSTATSKTGTGKEESSTVAVPDGVTAMSVNNVATWNTAVNRIRNGGNDQIYIINVTGNVSVPVIDENLFGSVTGLTVTIQGGGTLTISNTKGSLLRIGARQTIIARNVTLQGHSENNGAVVVIESGGTFRMEGNTLVTGNTGYYRNEGGSGVYVRGGTFIMQNGIISNNGSGVYIGSGIFIMQSGTISGNTNAIKNGDGLGSGVYMNDGIFTMESGTISGNTTIIGPGGGVYVRGGTFTMQGGTISSNNCANYGGGVFVNGGRIGRGTFNKTGGTIHGSDEPQNLRNSAKQQGHAVYLSEASNSGRWRNATAGPDDNTDSYGFWLND